MNHTIFDQPVHLIRNGRETDFSAFAIRTSNRTTPPPPFLFQANRLNCFRHIGNQENKKGQENPTPEICFPKKLDFITKHMPFVDSFANLSHCHEIEMLHNKIDRLFLDLLGKGELNLPKLSPTNFKPWISKRNTPKNRFTNPRKYVSTKEPPSPAPEAPLARGVPSTQQFALSLLVMIVFVAMQSDHLRGDRR